MAALNIEFKYDIIDSVEGSCLKAQLLERNIGKLNVFIYGINFTFKEVWKSAKFQYKREIVPFLIADQ